MERFSPPIKPADVVIDSDRDLVTIFGIRFAAEFFRTVTKPTDPGFALRVLKVEDGVVTIQKFECKDHP